MSASKKCSFRFYAELNDFLPKNKQFKKFTYAFNLNPSVKDAIEAVGVPHPEVDLILANNKSVSFNYHLNNDDFISVYPVFELLDITNVTRLRPKPLRKTKFILDVNLGRLAKKLRLLGFDSVYCNSFSNKEIIDTAIKEDRIILTRNIGLLKNRRITHGYWIRSAEVTKQTVEVLKKYDLYTSFHPYSLCMDCNGIIIPAAKNEIEHLLPPNTKKLFNDFFLCSDCNKVFWKGSHYKKMDEFIENIKETDNKCAIG